MTSFRATFGLTRSIGGWEEGERRERNKTLSPSSQPPIDRVSPNVALKLVTKPILLNRPAVSTSRSEMRSMCSSRTVLKRVEA